MPQVFIRTDLYNRPLVVEACYKCTNQNPGNYLCNLHWFAEAMAMWPDLDLIQQEAIRQYNLPDCIERILDNK